MWRITAVATSSIGNIILWTGTLVAGAAVGESIGVSKMSYSEHFLSVVPNNIVRPFLEGTDHDISRS